MALTAGIYGGGPFYSGGQSVIDDLKSSGFTTVIAWSIHVHSTGDLIYNDPTIVSNGHYIGELTWPGLLASLKVGTTSVDKLIFSVGAGGVNTFTTIQGLIKQQGTGPESILYRNFAALKLAIPTIDAIDFDDEDNYNVETVVAFGEMLGQIGYHVTFCPYTNMPFWLECLHTLNTKSPGLVSQFNLQCYSGGLGNNPDTWVKAVEKTMGPKFPAASFVFPGLACIGGPQCNQNMCPAAIQGQIGSWKYGLQGGWVWLYDQILDCASSGACNGKPMGASAYAQAVLGGLQNTQQSGK